MELTKNFPISNILKLTSTPADENGNDATQTAGWELINVDNAGKAKGHFDKDGNARHVDPVSGEGDKPIDDSDTPADGTISTEACNALPSPEIIPDP